MGKKKQVKRLTMKQTTFAMKVAQGLDATAAYRVAYQTSKMKDTTITNNAYMLLKNSEVAAMIISLQAANAKKHEVTVEKLNAKLDAAYASGMVNNQVSAAVAATMGMAKLNGLLVDKVDTKVNVTVETSYA